MALAATDPRQQLRVMSWVRIGFGLSVVTAPQRLVRATLGTEAARDATGYAMRMWGVRGAALGAITLRSLDGVLSRELVGINATVDRRCGGDAARRSRPVVGAQGAGVPGSGVGNQHECPSAARRRIGAADAPGRDR